MERLFAGHIWERIVVVRRYVVIMNIFVIIESHIINHMFHSTKKSKIMSKPLLGEIIAN